VSQLRKKPSSPCLLQTTPSPHPHRQQPSPSPCAYPCACPCPCPCPAPQGRSQPGCQLSSGGGSSAESGSRLQQGCAGCGLGEAFIRSRTCALMPQWCTRAPWCAVAIPPRLRQRESLLSVHLPKLSVPNLVNFLRLPRPLHSLHFLLYPPLPSLLRQPLWQLTLNLGLYLNWACFLMEHITAYCRGPTPPVVTSARDPLS